MYMPTYTTAPLSTSNRTNYEPPPTLDSSDHGSIGIFNPERENNIRNLPASADYAVDPVTGLYVKFLKDYYSGFAPPSKESNSTSPIVPPPPGINPAGGASFHADGSIYFGGELGVYPVHQEFSDSAAPKGKHRGRDQTGRAGRGA